MSKRVNNIFKNKIKFENMLAAYKRAAKGKKQNKEVILFQKSNSNLGIPTGNYTSQFFANIYLNELDHFVKENLKVKYYVRYMDDFILLLDTKETSKKV